MAISSFSCGELLERIVPHASCLRVLRTADPGISRLLPFLQQGLQSSEWPIGRRWVLFSARRRLAVPFFLQIPRVLIVMTVETQEFPVAAVRRVVVVVVILVMHRKLAELFACEFAAASRTDPRVHLERLLPIGLLAALSVTPSLSHDLIQPVGLRLRLLL